MKDDVFLSDGKEKMIETELVVHCSRKERETNTGREVSLIYAGSRALMQQYKSEHPLGEVTANGTLISSELYQEGGKIWCLSLEYQSTSDGSEVEPPPSDYGEKSVSLHGGLLSLPLESMKNYITAWNHYLAAAPGVKEVPGWWETAKDPVLDDDTSQKYAWIKSLSEIPVTGGKRWHILKDMVKPGVESVDMATWTVTETVKVRSYKDGVTLCKDRLNKIVAPIYSPKVTGNWKCDDVNLDWGGKYWLVTMTYTLSGNEKGWDTDFYKKV